MARKTFISYKYSEAQKLRDDIIEALGDDAIYYNGETSDSPDLTDLKTETIKNKLKDMIYNTSVTIVILSPNMKESKWIDWEIEYSLKEISREGRTSKTNGIVGVIKKVNGSYDWLISEGTDCHGVNILRYKDRELYSIIYENHFNSSPPSWHCEECKTYDFEKGGYITYIKEEYFLLNPQKHIEMAYQKSLEVEKYKIKK